MPDGNPATASNSMWRSLQWLAKEGERQLLNSIVLRGPCGRWVCIWKCKCVRPTNTVGLGLYVVPAKDTSMWPAAAPKQHRLFFCLWALWSITPTVHFLLMVCGSTVPTPQGAQFLGLSLSSQRPQNSRTRCLSPTWEPSFCPWGTGSVMILSSPRGLFHKEDRTLGVMVRRKRCLTRSWDIWFHVNLRWPEEPVHLQRDKENAQFHFLLPVTFCEKVYGAKQDPLTVHHWGAFVNKPQGQPASFIVQVYKGHTLLGDVLEIEKEQLWCE